MGSTILSYDGRRQAWHTGVHCCLMHDPHRNKLRAHVASLSAGMLLLYLHLKNVLYLIRDTWENIYADAA